MSKTYSKNFGAVKRNGANKCISHNDKCVFIYVYLFIYVFIYLFFARYLCYFELRYTYRKMLGILDYHLKPLMQRGWSYIKDSGDFIKNTRNSGSIPENAILVTADVLGLYPSIPHEAGLKALREVLDKRENNNYSY